MQHSEHAHQGSTYGMQVAACHPYGIVLAALWAASSNGRRRAKAQSDVKQYDCMLLSILLHPTALSPLLLPLLAAPKAASITTSGWQAAHVPVAKKNGAAQSAPGRQ